MYKFLEIIFWLCIALTFYTYIGYGLIVWVLVKIRQKLGLKKASLFTPLYEPTVTVVVPAYNERECIEAKWLNTLALDYPHDKLAVLFVTEGSTDGTTEYLQNSAQNRPSIKVIGGAIRRGKIEAVNEAMKHVKSDIVVFTDANTALNISALRKMARHFFDPKVGAVAGEKRIQVQASDAAAGVGEGLYWKYESFLKRLDTQLNSVVGAAGELFAVRRNLFQTVEKDTLLDDFVISLRIAEAGYQVVYEPEAYAIEKPSFSIDEEQKRKVRIAAGGFQAMSRLRTLLNVFKHPVLTFQYVSHRAMRWGVIPFCLVILLFSSGLLMSYSSLLYTTLFYLQLLFYAMALLGYMLEHQKFRLKLLFVPFYFTFMNACVILGFWQYRRGIQSGIWEKARRAF
jgi:cellulose synthase/poly-beta-1,6-N-acetylglucosamine synthase-like glycosyltransferase